MRFDIFILMMLQTPFWCPERQMLYRRALPALRNVPWPGLITSMMTWDLAFTAETDIQGIPLRFSDLLVTK
jgi:hypothetical protein